MLKLSLRIHKRHEGERAPLTYILSNFIFMIFYSKILKKQILQKSMKNSKNTNQKKSMKNSKKTIENFKIQISQKSMKNSKNINQKKSIKNSKIQI